VLPSHKPRDRRPSGSRCINSWNNSQRHRAFTIVELLVTITIIAVLLSLLLPGIQSARESGRRVQCADNLKNLGLALLSHHEVYRKFPCGGWGHQWIGVPERGTGPGQPGGWAYSALPFIEEQELHGLGMGLTGVAAVESYSQRLQTPLSLFVCPSRRTCSVWPIADQYSYVRTPRPFGNVTVVARGDYAINSGTYNVINLGGPADIDQGDDSNYWKNAPNVVKFNGISHLRRGAAMRSLADGASKTYLLGEKHLVPDYYATGTSPGDNESLYAGYCTDLHRFAGVFENFKLGMSPYAPPLNDNAALDNNIPSHVRFGSAHASGLNMAYCDGSLQYVSYKIDGDVHLRAGHRSDEGSPLDSLK
jgi:prepilin-type N-terminal cleavage/methylation domain-containing protein/prepilin-type processing-associated H-X9-DG protein